MRMKTHISIRDAIAVGACKSGVIIWCQSVGICADSEIAVENAIGLAKGNSLVIGWIEMAAKRNGYSKSDGDSDGDGDSYGYGYGYGYSDGNGGSDGDSDGDGYSYSYSKSYSKSDGDSDGDGYGVDG